MKKLGWALTAVTGLVAFGLALAASAHLTRNAVEAQSNRPVLSPTLAFVPETARVVGYLDLGSLSRSPLREKWEEEIQRRGAQSRLDTFRDMTGLDLLTDVEAVSFATETETSPEDAEPLPQHWGVALAGRFDGRKVLAKIRERTTAEGETDNGVAVYRLPAGDTGSGETAVALAGEHELLFGEPAYLRKMIDTAAGRRASAVPALTTEWGEESLAGRTFWIAVSPEKGFGSKVPALANVPPVESLILSGRLEGDVGLEARGKAADEAAANKLVEVVRGFIALGTLQGGRDPELSSIVDSIQVDQAGDEVAISLSVPYETLERLAQKAKRAEKSTEGEP